MAHIEARAWWADVEHLQDVYARTDEARRRADHADDVARHASPVRQHAEPDAARPAAATRRGAHLQPTAIPARRTVEIRGRTVPAPAVPRSTEIERRRPPRRPIERVGARPDRLAMWALLMGIVLILVAVGTADASVI
ncbi:MAG: hypothetical protein AVDCRST_MAG67-4549 [uncultured Solirubrobacteraceae bacterium]|uniref:Uncharacterized protein n=1 Tax=uncultured Solirubrobacteraceae bacterium TaxID=1162706 RepID=A0A6J4TW91_9ACTN|nr:MAG: hypothetical protein AVDCRST_MAG67-4549 [uncultured Solirubrobacteraceae bacterium]